MGAWQEIVDYTFTANETSRTFTGFGTITKDDFVKVEVSITTATSTDSFYRLFPNGETTATNYYRQRLRSFSSTVSADRGNNADIGFVAGVDTIGGFQGYFKLSENDRYNIFINDFHEYGDDVRLAFYYVTSSGVTFPSGITSLTLQASATNGLGTGTRIQIYKLAAEKVADITVASNTTQVDISNLSIDKDSEYLLVSDIVNPTGSFTGHYMTPNDLTTLNQYYYQRILGDGGASAERFAEPRVGGVGSNNRVINHTHIKLSNIGAYTFQTYGLLNVGNSSIAIVNYFVSSIAENFTNITKLNFISGVSNSIGAGSTFTLYKLY